MQTFPISVFHWDKTFRTLSTEISMLSNSDNKHQKVNERFVVNNPKTGQSCEFLYSHVDRNRESEITAWVFESVSNESNKRGIKIVIFND